jgi:hypothetical protein
MSGFTFLPLQCYGERYDCAVHALAAVAGISYQDAHQLLARMGRRARCRTKHLAHMLPAMRAAGLTMRTVCTPTLARRADLLSYCRPRGTYYVRTTHHSLAVLDHQLVDTWPQQSPRALLRQVIEVSRQNVTPVADSCISSAHNPPTN